MNIATFALVQTVLLTMTWKPSPAMLEIFTQSVFLKHIAQWRTSGLLKKHIKGTADEGSPGVSR